jgi:hypothetical protein
LTGWAVDLDQSEEGLQQTGFVNHGALLVGSVVGEASFDGSL